MFPDEFHLHTLETLLGVCSQLQPGVKVGGVLAGLMARLAKCAAETPGAVAQFHELGAFSKFSEALSAVTAAQPDMPTADIVAMFSSLMAFAIQVHREELGFVDQVLQGCAETLSGRGKVSETEPKAVKGLVSLLTAPLEAYDVVSVLSLGSYPKVMGVVEAKTRKQVAVTIVRSVLKSGTVIHRVDQARTRGHPQRTPSADTLTRVCEFLTAPCASGTVPVRARHSRQHLRLSAPF